MQLPEKSTEEFKALRQTVNNAIERGDVQTVQAVGLLAVNHVHSPCATQHPLRVALKSHDVPMVAWLVEESERTGIDVAWRWKAIHLAAYRGDMDKLKAASDEELAQKAVDEETVLHAAALGDQAEAIEYLVLERDMFVHVQTTGSRRSALDEAVDYGCLSAIEALAKCGALRCGRPGEPIEATLAAVMNGQVDVMEKLVEVGATITGANSLGRCAVVHAAARSGSVEVIKAAVRLGADPCAVTPWSGAYGRTALHIAAAEHSLSWVSAGRAADVIMTLVQLGVSPDVTAIDGQTALHLAGGLPHAARAGRGPLDQGQAGEGRVATVTWWRCWARTSRPSVRCSRCC